MKRSTKWISFLLSTGFVVVLQGQACGRVEMKAFEATTLNSELPPHAGPTPPIDDSDTETPIEKVSDSYRIAHVQEVMPAALSILDQPTSSTILSIYNSSSANLSEDGDVSSINSPMLNSILTISGTICSEMITKEKKLLASDRTIFKSLDFTKAPNAQAAGAIDQSLQIIARRAWLRNMTSDETKLFTTALASVGTTRVEDTTLQALFICSAMMSSLDTISR